VRAPFFLYAATLGVAGGIAMVYLAKAALREDAAGGGAAPARTTLREALASQPYRTALVTNFGTGWTTFGVRSSLLPLFVLEAMQRDARWTGIGFVLSAATQGALLLPAGRFTDTRGRRPAVIVGTSAATVSTLLLAASTSPVTYVLAMLLFGAGFAFLSPASAAIVGDVVSGRGGTVVAAFQMSADVGAVVGPIAAGWLADSVGYGAAWAASAGVLALGLLMGLAMPETRLAAPARTGDPPAAGERDA
jgi:MFS family permease